MRIFVRDVPDHQGSPPIILQVIQINPELRCFFVCNGSLLPFKRLVRVVIIALVEVSKKLGIILLRIDFLELVGLRKLVGLGLVEERVVRGFFGADPGAVPKLLIYYIC